MNRLIARDLRLAVRAGGGFGLGLAFFLIVSVLVPLAVGPERSQLAAIAPGILWVAALLACLLSLDRMFALDWEDGSLDLLATAPVPLESVALAKGAAHWLTTGLPLTLLAPLLGLFLNLPSAGYTMLVLTLAIGTPALSMIGAFGADSLRCLEDLIPKVLGDLLGVSHDPVTERSGSLIRRHGIQLFGGEDLVLASHGHDCTAAE